MNNKNLLLGTLTLLGASSCTDSIDDKSRPNVVFIYFDDMGYGDISHFNPDSKIRTPIIDSMARAGMTFTDAHSAVAVSTPSRYSVLTGRYAFRSALKRQVATIYTPPLISKETPTMAEMFKANGYQTAHVGKWHVGQSWALKDGGDYLEAVINARSKKNSGLLDPGIDYTKAWTDGPNQHGFDYSATVAGTLIENGQPLEVLETNNGMSIKGGKSVLFPYEIHVPTWVEKSNEFIKEAATKDDPFFLYYALTAPHKPHVPSEQFVGKSGIGVYGDFMLECDWVVGELFKTLEEAGIADNTLVIFSSDNGPETCTLELKTKFGHYSAGEFRGHKRLLFEGGHRVPTFAYWKGVIDSNSVCDKTISQIDLYATFAELLGYQLADNEAVDSRSFLPALKGCDDFEREGGMVEQSSQGYLALRMGDYKFITTPAWMEMSKDPKDPSEDENNFDQEPYQLYNVKEDINERNNLYSKMPEKAAELKAILREYIINGRSTEGSHMKNDDPFPYDSRWSQIDWVNE